MAVTIVKRTGPRVTLVMLGVAVAAGAMSQSAPADQTMPRPEWRRARPTPREYVAPQRRDPVLVDGRLDEPAWSAAAWSEPFTDIEGSIRPAPRHATQVKMLWDDTHWYIGARLEEPDLWGTIRERDAVIFHDNDFELFVDPDGDTHRYFELEINALGTVWDLFLPRPYRDGGRAVDAWNIESLRAAVALDGTLNDARDRDRGWTVELAIPWDAFADSGRTTVPPGEGDAWRVNFSRVQWDLDRTGDGYRKRTDPATGKPLAEHNWVWSPQGAINMHIPELWGLVHFGRRNDPDPAAEEARWALRRVYYAQREYRKTHSEPAAVLDSLGVDALPAGLHLARTVTGWIATVSEVRGGAWRIDQDGRIWKP